MSTGDSHSQMGQSVGAKIRAARQAKKYTQSQLAAPDFSVSYISAIERGQIRPSLRALEILARRLGLSSTQLLPGSNGKNIAIQNVQLRSQAEIAFTLLEAEVLLLQGNTIAALAHLGKLSLKNLNRQQQV